MGDTFKIIGGMLVCFMILCVMGLGVFFTRGCNEAADVVHEEFGPRAMKTKYEWFVKQHERIEKAREDILTFENTFTAFKERFAMYGDPKDWPPDVRVQYNAEAERHSTDLTAMISNHDNMVRDYNAASKNFLWDKFDPEGKYPRQHNEYAVK